LNSVRWKSLLYVACAFIVGIVVGVWWPRGAPQPAESNPSPSAATKIPSNQGIIGFLNMIDGKPVISAPSSGAPQVSGWAACVDEKSTLTSVEVLVDKNPVTTANTGSPRPDVAKAYGRGDFEKSGWKASIPVAGLKAGDHELAVRVTCSAGEKALLPPFRLLIPGS
jgi:hypothetical protein